MAQPRSLSLPENLIPLASQIGLHDLYMSGRNAYGYVFINNKRYRVLDRLIKLYRETGRTRMTKEDWDKKVYVGYQKS